MISARERGKQCPFVIDYWLFFYAHLYLMLPLLYLSPLPPIEGPGPGIYGLPPCMGYRQHDPTKKVMPAHSFGRRQQSSCEK